MPILPKIDRAALLAILAAACDPVAEPRVAPRPPDAQPHPAMPSALPIASTSAGVAPIDTASVATSDPDALAHDSETKVVLDWLRPGLVYDDRFARRELYTWTTAEQIAELRKSPVLLTRATSPGRGSAFFDRRLDADPSIFSRALRSSSFARSRFGWPNPWATVLGPIPGVGETYGDRLIRVLLKADSIIAKYDGKWSFSDLSGRAISADDARRDIARLAAVYHVFRDESMVTPGSVSAGRLACREYVICNESMIEEWSVGAPETVERVASDVAGLGSIHNILRRHPLARTSTGAFADMVVDNLWGHAGAREDLIDFWAASTAFPLVDVDQDLIDRIGQTLEALPREPFLRHNPTARFGGADWAKLAKLPYTHVSEPVRPCVGTFCP